MTRKSPSKELESNHCPYPTRNPKNPYRGVYQRKYGKWVSEIRDPVTQSRLHLGTFLSAEAAHGAYCAKKLELDEKAASHKPKKASGFGSFHSEHSSNQYSDQKDGFRRRKWTKSGTVSGPSRYPTRVRVGKTSKASFGYVSGSDSDNSSSDWRSEEGKKVASDEDFDSENTCRFLRRPKNGRSADREKANELISSGPKTHKIKLVPPYEGIVQKPSGKFEATIRDPVACTKSYLGMFGSAEAAHAAWCAKKLEIDEKNSKNVNNYKQVVKTKSGNRWVARIRHPTKGLISLGNFGSKEAAFRAHYRKKLEIEENESDKTGEGHIESPPKPKIISEGVYEEEKSGGNFGSKEAAFRAHYRKSLEIEENESEKIGEGHIESPPKPNIISECLFEEEKSGKTCPESPMKQKFISKSPYRGVREMTPGKWVSKIWNPVTKKWMWIGTFGSAEAAYEAYCAKKLEIKEQAASERNEREVEKTRACSKSPYCSYKPEIEGKADLEEKKPQEGAYGPDTLSHIVDRNGFLLGEFSLIDDLAICDAE